MNDFENIFELAGDSVAEALDDIRRGYEPEETVFFLDGDEEAGQSAAERIHFSAGIEDDLAIMRANWGCATMGILILPRRDEATGQRALNVWAFGYKDGAEAQFAVSYICDEEGLLIHDVQSAIKVPAGAARDVYAHVAVLDFLNGATDHPTAGALWTPENVEKLRSNISTASD